MLVEGASVEEAVGVCFCLDDEQRCPELSPSPTSPLPVSRLALRLPFSDLCSVEVQ